MFLIRTLVWKFQKISSPSTACFIQNLIQAVKGRSTRFYFEDKTGLFYAKDGKTHYFANMERGFALYSGGLEHRCKKLLASYMISDFELNRDDVVIDCGANYGDLFLALSDKIKPSNYFSFEPGEDEYKCLKKNARDGNNFNVALSNETGEQDFFVSSSGGDSSLIEPKTFTDIIKSSTKTLDSVIVDNNIKRIKLLKLEAEGFEPEILEGAMQSLSICEYVAIDGGNERGVNEEETFSVQTNILLKNGFEMMGVYFKWGRALFKNMNI